MSKPVKLLILENSQDNAQEAIRRLQRAGFDPSYRLVQRSAELEAALKRERWDAVISAFTLPGFTGIDALRTLRSLGLDIPFVLVDDAIGEQAAVEAMKAGASDCIKKSGAAGLVQTLERVLRETALRAAQRQSEHDLIESEKRFRELFNGNPLPVWVFDIETLRFLDVNDVACRTYGYTRDEFLALTPRDVRPPEDIPAMELTVRRPQGVLDGGIWRHRKKDGTIFFAEIASHNATYRGREARYACVIDVTQRLQAEERIRKLSQAVEQSPAATVITDSEGRIEYVNPKFTEVSGYAAEEAIGKTPAVINSGLTPLATYQDMWKTIKSGASWRGTLRNRKKNGEIYWEDECISPLKNERGEIINFIAVKEDITDRKKAEDEVLRLNADLERRVAERTAELEAANSELRAFAHSVSHDLRAPVNRIRGFSAMLLGEEATKLDERGADLLRRIGRAGHEMEQLIGDLLALSTVTAGELHRSDVDLSALASALFSKFQNTEPDRKTEVVVEPGLTARADPGLVRIVLDNLIGNAWKFTGKRNGARIEIGCKKSGKQREFFVRDNGAGFDPANASKLFAPFQRLHTKNEFEGTGIGLATVQRIVLRHGGRVWAEGAVDQGATIRFTLAP